MLRVELPGVGPGAPGAAGAGLRLGLSIGCSSMVKHWQLKLYDSSPGFNSCMVTASSIIIYILYDTWSLQEKIMA